MAIFAAVPTWAAEKDFHFQSLHIDYYLGADDEGRSTLKTIERLTATPTQDGDYAFDRVIPEKYDGHPTNLRIKSVTDKTGKPLAYSTSESANDVILHISGSKTPVVITYTQRDVTRYVANAEENEFYWAITGTKWERSFDEVVATVHVGDAIKPTLNKKLTCSRDIHGSTRPCSVVQEGNVITAKADGVSAGENITLAIGFTPGTFRGYQAPPRQWSTIFIAGGLVVVAIVAGVALYRWTRRIRKSKHQG